MTDQQRRRLRSQPSARPAGAPNVLSNEAKPNTLSTMGRMTGGITAAAAPSKGSPRPAAASMQPVRPTIAARGPGSTTGPMAPADDRIERPRRRPTLGTVIFIGFVIFWAARLFNGAGVGTPTPTPRPTTAIPRQTASAPRTPIPNTIYGAVTFGSAHADDCRILSTAPSFSAGVDVWWRADLLQVQPANAAIVVVTLKNGSQVDYEYVPPDPSVGKWQVFCAGPAKDDLAGTYRIEIWNAERSKLLAKGEFVRLGPSASPAGTPTATRDPNATAAATKPGTVTFGTALLPGCALAGVDTTFGRVYDVWWKADFRNALPADTEVLVLTWHDGREVGVEPIQHDASEGSFTSLCGPKRTVGVSFGSFTVEVWDADESTLLSTGTFKRT